MYFAMTLLVFTALNVHVIDVHILSVYFRIYRQSSGCTQVLLLLVCLYVRLYYVSMYVYIYIAYMYMYSSMDGYMNDCFIHVNVMLTNPKAKNRVKQTKRF